MSAPQFGTIHEKLTDRVQGEQYHFYAADVTLDGDLFSASFELDGFLLGGAPDSIVPLLRQNMTALWVRARLPRVFGIEIGEPTAEKSLMQVGLVAEDLFRDRAYPFLVSDYYGRAHLVFSRAGPDAEVKFGIARQFWDLLLQVPQEVVDFKASFYHIGASVWVDCQCREGVYYVSERDA